MTLEFNYGVGANHPDTVIRESAKKCASFIDNMTVLMDINMVKAAADKYAPNPQKDIMLYKGQMPLPRVKTRNVIPKKLCVTQVQKAMWQRPAAKLTKPSFTKMAIKAPLVKDIKA
eukprot:563237-Ditylum_brightwellii.AAC.1